MSITSDILFAGGAGAEMSSGSTSYRDVRRFIFDSVPVSAAAALTMVKTLYPIGAAGLSGSSLDSVSLSQIAPLAWEGTLSYSTKTGSYTPEPGGGQPDSYTKRVTWGKWAVSRVVEADTRPTGALNPNNRKNIANSAGDRFAPAFTKETWYPQITIELNSSDGTTTPIQYVGGVNSTAMTICGIDVPRFCCMLVDYACNKADDGRYRRTFTFNLNFSLAPPGYTLLSTNRTGFIVWVLNAGLNKKVSGQRVPIYFNNEPVTSPVPISLEAGGPGGDVTPLGDGYTPIYLDFMPYDIFDFAGLLPPFDELQ
jgi:hypothetical protein